MNSLLEKLTVLFLIVLQNILSEYGWNRNYPKNGDLEWQIQSWEKNNSGRCTWNSVDEKPKFCYDEIKHNKKNVEKYKRKVFGETDWTQSNVMKTDLQRFFK